jgi:predicted permease
MTTLRHVVARLRALWRGGDLDRDFEQELQSHLAMLTDDNIRNGMAPGEARRQAAIRLGAAGSLHSQHRDARGLPAFESLLQDLRFAGRLSIKDRWLSATIVAVLALGIGANTFGFALVNAAFWRGLPVPGSGRFVMVSWLDRDGRRDPASHVELLEWQQATQFDGLAGYQETQASLSDGHAPPERIHRTRMTTNGFALLGLGPSLGRDFTAADGGIGSPPVVILSDPLWRRRYGSDPKIVGTAIRIDGAHATVIGVMSEGMLFPDRSDVWVPFVPAVEERAREARGLEVIGRLAPESGQRQARAELETISRAQMSAHPVETNGVTGIRVESVADNTIGGMGRRLITILMAATAFVLVIAVANVVILLLLRSGARAREMALRAAVGATRGRLVRQLLIESLLLSLAGAAAGLAIAAIAVQLFAAAVGEWLPYWVVWALDYRAFGYAAAIGIATAVVFGLAPLVSLHRGHAMEAIHDGGRGTIGGVRIRRLTTALVVAELSMAIALLGGAGLLARSVAALSAVDLGVDTSRLVTMNITLPEARYPTPESRRQFASNVQGAIAAIAGVETATITTGVPARDGGERLMEIEGWLEGQAPVFVSTVAITPTFFDTLGIGLTGGSNFGELDGAPGSDVAIINQRLAAQYFPGQDPIGRRLRFTVRRLAPGQAPGRWRTIVGVAPDVSHGSPADGYINAAVYVPYREMAAAAVSLLINTARAPESIIPQVLREVQKLDADLPIVEPRTIRDLLAGDRGPYRLYGLIFAAFAVIAVALSAAAVYAVIAYAVARRQAEFGVRAALGASAPTLVWLVLRPALAQLAVGITIGLAGAIATGRALAGMLVGVTAGDPITLFGIAVTLTVVGIAASLRPALRAARVNPATVLRAE